MKHKDSEHNIILQSVFRATLIAMIVADLAEVIAAGIDGMLTGRYLGANSLAAFGIAKPFYSITGIYKCCSFIWSYDRLFTLDRQRRC